MASSLPANQGGNSSSAATLKSQSSTRNQEATIYVGNLDEKFTEPLLWELMLQVGPVVHVHIPRDRITQIHQGYGFVEFGGEDDAEYALKVMSGIRLFGKPLRLNKSSGERKNLDVGANIFVGNLAPDADEKVLFDTFILFGTLLSTPKVAREESTGVSKGYAFLSYDSFEAADAAIESMNGQYLCNRPITVNYAFKKDGKGERHGSAAERLLAAQAKKAAAAATANTGMSATQPTNLQMGGMVMAGHQQMMMNPVGMYATPSTNPQGMPGVGGAMPGMPPNMMYYPAYQQYPLPSAAYPGMMGATPGMNVGMAMSPSMSMNPSMNMSPNTGMNPNMNAGMNMAPNMGYPSQQPYLAAVPNQPYYYYPLPPQQPPPPPQQ